MTETKNPPTAKPQQHPTKVVPITVKDHCAAEGCKNKDTLAGFCNEHFEWFKEGLITKNGKHPKDFEKKYYDYQRRKKKSA